MTKFSTITLLGAGLLTCLTPNLSQAQISSESSLSYNTATTIDKATSSAEFASELSNELAKCHGFQYALHYFLTKEIEMSIDTVKLEADIAASAQAAGYASVLVGLFHSEDVGHAHRYANAISEGERSLWKAKFETSKENFAVISKERIQTCNGYKPVVNALLPDVY